MSVHQCEDCHAVFKLKTDLKRHQNKQNPCVPANVIIEKHKAQIIEEVSNVESINKVKKFLDFCHNTLRDKEGIVGMRALSNIAMLLFLKFVNNSVREGTIDLLEIEKYRKEEGTDKDEKFQMYKEYIKYCQFTNIIEDGKFKIETTELIFIVEYIFKHVLWYHPDTKNIFTDEFPSIKNEITYEQIFKQMDKINWDDMDIDIKGLAYEHFLKDEMGGGDLGQFFTKREVVDYMIQLIKPNICETSTFIDPFMGTGGFITHMYNEIKLLYKKKKIPFTNEIRNNLTNGIEKNPQTCLLALNNMLLNMDLFPTNVNCNDSFRNYIDKKYDICCTNPPFGIKGLTYDNESMFPEEYNGIKKKDYIPHKSNDAICLALQMIQFILKKNGICAIVVPDGKQMSNVTEKSLIAVRKMLIENNNIYQITKLPSGTFLPYTGVETMVLFFKKGEKTKNIKFVKLDNKYKTETLICNVTVDKIIKQKYSLNHKLYIDNNIILHTNIEYIQIMKIFDYIEGTVQSGKVNNIENGKYSFITGAEDYKFKKVNNIENVELIDGENVFISHRGNGNSRPIKYYNGQCYFSDLMTVLKPKININIKYCYYFLKFNQKYIEDNFQKGACNKTLDFTLFNQMKIPVPPIPVQQLIVKELDSMYKQKENLQNANNEMNTFKKAMFEILLLNCSNIKIVKMSEIVNFSGGKFTTSEMNNMGNYNFYNASIKNPIGKHDEYCFDGDEYILFIKSGGNAYNKVSKTHGLGLSILVNGKNACVSDVLKINILVDNVNVKFLYYYMYYLQDDIQENANYTTSLGHCNMDYIKLINLQIPSIEDQEKIVSQMQIYDNLVSLQKQQIDAIDLAVKERFEFHLKKCTESAKTNNDDKKVEEVEEVNEVEADKVDKIKVIKSSKKNKSKQIDNSDNESIQTTNSNTDTVTTSETKKEYEIVSIDDTEYIKEGIEIYKIKDGLKGKLFAQIGENGKYKRIKTNKAIKPN